LKWEAHLTKMRAEKENKIRLRNEAKEQKEALAKEVGARCFALTGNFGYQRAFIGLVLRSLGYTRTKRVNKTTGFLIVGDDHRSGPI